MEEIKLPLQSVTKVIGLDTVDSTQSLAKVLAQQGAEDGTLVLAGEQTAGRGRYDRSFSAAHGGVYFTLILRPGKPDGGKNSSGSTPIIKAPAGKNPHRKHQQSSPEALTPV